MPLAVGETAGFVVNRFALLSGRDVFATFAERLGGSMHFQDVLQPLSSDEGGRAAPDAGECQMATAAEMMFFNGAPLAHVVAYREHLRMESIARRYQEFSIRTRRLRSIAHAPMLTEWMNAG